MSDTLQALITSTQKRADMGKAKYGVYLTAANGRNPLVDAFQEALDQLVYLRQAIEDEYLRQVNEEAMPPIHPNYTTRPEPAPIYNPDLTPIFQLVIDDLQERPGLVPVFALIITDIQEMTNTKTVDPQNRPWYFASDLHYIYYSAIQIALHLQRMINAELMITTEA